MKLYCFYEYLIIIVTNLVSYLFYPKELKDFTLRLGNQYRSSRHKL